MLVCDLLSKDNIYKYECDTLVVNSSEYSLFNDKTFSLNELEEVVDLIHRTSKKAILSIDRIIEEFEINDFYSYLSKCFSINFDYYSFSDLSVINYVIDNNLSVNLIYDSKTLSSNSHDCKLYSELLRKFNNKSNIYPIISNELTLDDIVINSNAANVGVVVYGYHQIFYSRRLIFSSYINYKKNVRHEEIDDKLPNSLHHLKEEFRDELYPIYQSKFGTFVYTAKKFCLFEELDKLSNIFMFKINGQFITENDLLRVVSIYNNLLNNANLKEKLNDELLDIDNKLTKGFLFQDSVLLKGDGYCEKN